MRRAYSADRGFNWYIARLGPGAGTYHGSAATIRAFVKMDQSLFWTIQPCGQRVPNPGARWPNGGYEITPSIYQEANMGGFNLPPGVGPGDIPGNRQEDMWEEAFIDAFDTAVEKAGLELFEDWPNHEPFWKVITIARDLGYNQGFGEGKDEGIMSMEPDDWDNPDRDTFDVTWPWSYRTRHETKPSEEATARVRELERMYPSGVMPTEDDRERSRLIWRGILFEDLGTRGRWGARRDLADVGLWRP